MKPPTNFEISPDQDQILLFDENIVLETDKAILKCRGCWFLKIPEIEFSNINKKCSSFFNCVTENRKDKKDIIWIEVK